MMGRSEGGIQRPALLLLAAACLLGAAPAPQPVGTFHQWSSWRRAPLTFTSGGLTVSVEALPCPVPATGDSTCRWEGYNNQARVTIAAPGLAPVQVVTDRQSAYARVAVVRFDRRDARPGVVVESQYGGSGGVVTVQFLAPTATGFQRLALDDVGGAYVEGALADHPRDRSGDGIIDFVLTDGGFGDVFGCNACTPRPPVVYAVKGGALIDESRDPLLARVFLADMAVRRRICFSRQQYRNGPCATYVADAARAGRFKQAWAGMLRHYERRGTGRWPLPTGLPHQDFPDALRAFLHASGYLPR